MTCQKPVWYYALDVQYYVPVEGNIYVSDMCIYHDGKVVIQTAAQVLTRAGLQSVAHRHSLDKHHAGLAAARGSLASRTGCSRTRSRWTLRSAARRASCRCRRATAHRALAKVPAHRAAADAAGHRRLFAGLASHIACSGVGVAGFDVLLAGAAYTAGFCGGGSPIDPAAIRALEQAQADTKAALDAQLRATQQVYNSLNSFASQVRDLAENQALINAGVRDQLQTANQRTTVAFNQGSAALQAAVHALPTHTANRFAQLSQYQISTNLLVSRTRKISGRSPPARPPISRRPSYTTNISYQLSNQTEQLRGR